MNIKNKSSLFSLPLIGAYVSRMVRHIEKYGMQGAILKEIERSGSKLEIYGLNKNTKTILQEKPVIIVCNHSFEIETLAILASLPPGDDLYMVATYKLLNFGKEISKNIIPVYVQHNTGNMKADKIRYLLYKIMEKFQRFEKFSEKEEREKNILSINLATNKVLKGGLVIMFPNPHCQKWYSGIGWLLKNIGPENNVYYVKVYVDGTSNFDYLRLISNAGRFLPKIKVHFAQPQKIFDFDSRNPKRLTAKLEKKYLDWTTYLC